jgi:hypothetical protein
MQIGGQSKVGVQKPFGHVESGGSPEFGAEKINEVFERIFKIYRIGRRRKAFRGERAIVQKSGAPGLTPTTGGRFARSDGSHASAVEGYRTPQRFAPTRRGTRI